MNTIENILQYLESQGYTQPIDSRMEREVIKEIQFAFPDIEVEALEKVLTIMSKRP